MKALEFLDFLGKKPTLLIDKQNSHKSLLGGILSLLTIMGILAGIGYFASILFSRETFNLVGNQQLNLTQSMLLSDFPIAVNLADQFGVNFAEAERIFEVSILWYSFKPYKNPLTNQTNLAPIIVQLPVETCTPKNNNHPKFKDLYAKELDSRGFCIGKTAQNISLTSPLGYATTSSLTFFFYKCQNNTSIGKTNCLPPEVIQSKLSHIYLATTFVDYYFDHSNILEPAQPYFRKEAISTGSSPYIFRELTLSMKNVDYFSDLNYLVTNPEKMEFNVLDLVKDTTSMIRDNVIPGSFTSLSISMSSLKQIYNRKYYKLQNMLADLGGLVKALIMILLNLNLYFSNQTFFNKVIDANVNSLYIRNIRKALLLDVPQGEGKQRGTVNSSQDIDRKFELKYQSTQTQKLKEGSSANSPANYKKYFDQRNKDLEQEYPTKLIYNNKTNKTLGSEMGYASERMPVKEEMTFPYEPRHARPNSDLELVRLPNEETAKAIKENDETPQPSRVELKKNANVVYRKFEINICGYILPACCFKKGSQSSKQIELHKKFSEIINGHLDIINISKKLHTVDKINYVLCGDQFRNLLETTINPYLYQGTIPKSSDICEAREKIVTSLKLYEK